MLFGVPVGQDATREMSGQIRSKLCPTVRQPWRRYRFHNKAVKEIVNTTGFEDGKSAEKRGQRVGVCICLLCNKLTGLYLTSV